MDIELGDLGESGDLKLSAFAIWLLNNPTINKTTKRLSRVVMSKIPL
jgi:hypothetical protein